MSEVLKGRGVSPGIATGVAHLLHAESVPIVPVPVPPERVDEEIDLFEQARLSAQRELAELKGRVVDVLGEHYAAILGAQLLILDDPSLVSQTIQRIRVGRVSARWALKEVVGEFSRKFDAMDDVYLRERGGDLSDVHRRLQRLLRGGPDRKGELADGPRLVVAHSLVPSDAVALAGRGVVGLATDVGGPTSHTAILAQALSVPAVAGLHDISQRVRPGEPMIIDGDAGVVHLLPGEGETASAERRRRAWIVREREASVAARELPSTTRDGVEITIRANIEFASEVDTALQFGALGVGLYRSEFLFLARSPEFPTEQEHYETYRDIARKVAPHPATVRTLDLGGEKYFHEMVDRDETNPVLGLRAVRLGLERPDIFRPQLRGLLRAATEENLRVLLPLVTTANEVREVRRLLSVEADQLRSSGVAVRADVPLGVMIEVPGAAAAADILACEADFLSLGTNDLIQYALAVDRGNEAVSYLYQPRHPGVLRMIRFVVESARGRGIPLALCGEMAADADCLSLLIGLGLRELSIQPRAIGSVRGSLGRIDSRDATREAESALAPPGCGPRDPNAGLNRFRPEWKGKEANVERVNKPWGYELRFIRTDRYAGKLLFITAGSQLSLQYHEKKDEAFLLHDGDLELVLGQGDEQRVERMGSGDHRHITPRTVHRFRAVTDCTLFEVSTPELEDVVRLEDDFGREGTTDAPGPG